MAAKVAPGSHARKAMSIDSPNLTTDSSHMGYPYAIGWVYLCSDLSVGLHDQIIGRGPEPVRIPDYEGALAFSPLGDLERSGRMVG